MNTLTIVVPGIPKPQGSKTARVYNGRAIMFEAAKGAREWRTTVVEYAWQAAQDQQWTTVPRDKAVNLHVISQFVPPPSWPKYKREAALRGEIPHTSKPDADKLARNIGDALTQARVYVDDSQVTPIISEKKYGETACAFIQVTYA